MFGNKKKSKLTKMMDHTYVPQHLRLNRDEMMQYYQQLGEHINDQHIYDIVVMVEYVFYHPDNDGGLALFNRINNKIRLNGDWYKNEENIEEVKNRIRNNEISFMDALRQTWSPATLHYYGV